MCWVDKLGNMQGNRLETQPDPGHMRSAVLTRCTSFWNEVAASCTLVMAHIHVALWRRLSELQSLHRRRFKLTLAATLNART
jgi:hypothetical protein